MKFGFNMSDEEDHENDPEVGYADSTTEEETSFWQEIAYPMFIDFAICYGVLSVVRDLINTCRRGKYADL